MFNMLILDAIVTCRKLKQGFMVRVRVMCNKFETGSRLYKKKILFVGDIDHWIAKLITELTSDIEKLHLHNAIRGLENTYSCGKNICWNMLKGLSFAVNIDSKAYYNSRVYEHISVTNAIKAP